MLNRSLSAIALASLIAITSHAAAQNPPKPKRKNETGAAAAADKAPKSDSVRKAEKARTTHFFDSETPLTMSLTFNYKKLRGDRDATKSPWRDRPVGRSLVSARASCASKPRRSRSSFGRAPYHNEG